MSEVQNQNTEEVKNDNVEVAVVEKEGFFQKVGNGCKKVFSSKPAKIIGGVVLAAGGGFVGYQLGKNSSEDQPEVCYDEDDDELYGGDAEFAEYVENESAIAD